MPQDKTMKILKSDSLPSNAGSLDYFTGVVRVTPLVQGDEPSCMTCGRVTFDPSARSAWHTHPKGQLLIVVDGLGLIQEWEKPVQHIKKGDMIWTSPGVKHWHGAIATAAMTHIAITESLNGKVVEWLEKVTDEEYMAETINHKK